MTESSSSSLTDDGSMAAHAAACGNCRHFFNASPAIESALPGLSSLSSAYASVRADDGVCSLHDRYIAAESLCASHASRPVKAPRLQPDGTALMPAHIPYRGCDS
jgi:hypothetical protein